MVNPAAASPGEFEEFVEEHYRAAYHFALSLCCHKEDACDLTQQAFCIAQSKLHQVREKPKQKSWLFVVIRHEFLRCRQERAMYEHHPLELVERELPSVIVDHATGIDAAGLLAALLKMEERFRVPLSLFYFEQLSYKEIAMVIDAPIGTVMSRLARGKELLRRVFGPAQLDGDLSPNRWTRRSVGLEAMPLRLMV